VIMSVLLLGSSFVVTTLIEPGALENVDARGKALEGENLKKPPAKDRALAYLAHGEGKIKIAPFTGETFGTIYDLVTVVILWFAGASAMAGLLNLVPQYLPRYGMAPEWARAMRPLVLLFTGINLLVTFIFDASVDAQGDAYATGVLVLMTSGAIASVIDRWNLKPGRRWYRRLSWSFSAVSGVFLFTTIDIVIGKPEGIKIASFFIITILVTSFISRAARSRELRFQGFHIPDVESKLYWDSIKHLELSVLVPHRPGRRSLPSKEAAIRREHRIPRDIEIIFVEVDLLDPSEFISEPWLEVHPEEGRYVMKISHASSIAHTLAAVALEMTKVGRPPEIHFGWTDETPWSGTIGFLLFGEGNIPWMVRELIRKAEPDPERRPFIVVAGV
ncbi:MAG: amino acid transporter, partial [Planctomycetes bacterium]|nr:amino acid transporter [Planctomycetota bacterium]